MGLDGVFRGSRGLLCIWELTAPMFSIGNLGLGPFGAPV